MIPLGLDEIARVIGVRSRNPVPAIGVGRVCIDSREAQAGDLFLALPGTKADGHDFVDDAFRRGAYGCVVDHAVTSDFADSPNRALLQVPDVLTALGQLAAFHRQQIAATVIAVTGSNGKTTVRAMIDHVLATRLQGRSSIKSYNNEIGLPLTLLAAVRADDYLVAEIGANAPGEIASLARIAAPNIAVLTSIGEAHLAGFVDVEGVVREKMSLMDGLRPAGCAVINVDHPLTRQYLTAHEELNRVTFGTHESADVRVTDIELLESGVRFRLNDRLELTLPLHGAHSAVNAAAAFAVCRRMKVEECQIIDALRVFRPVPMRLNVRCVGTVTLIDDCYNSNPSSLRAAAAVLQSLPGRRKVAIVGDMLELGENTTPIHEGLGRELAELGVECVLGVGQQARAVAMGARSAGLGTRTEVFETSQLAADSVARGVVVGDVILVKGSRGVALEWVVKAIENAVANGEGFIRLEPSPIERRSSCDSEGGSPLVMAAACGA